MALSSYGTPMGKVLGIRGDMKEWWGGERGRDGQPDRQPDRQIDGGGEETEKGGGGRGMKKASKSKYMSVLV